jgi:hypothetical protein
MIYPQNMYHTSRYSARNFVFMYVLIRHTYVRYCSSVRCAGSWNSDDTHEHATHMYMYILHAANNIPYH